MTTLQIDETPNSAIPALATKLVLTWICSLLWGSGIFLSALGFMAATLAGLINYFGPPMWNTQSTYMLIAGFLATFLSPLFLGTYFSHSWRKGFTSGLFALFMAAVGVFLFYVLAGFLYATFSVHEHVFYSFLSAFPAALAIITILLWNRFPYSQLGIALGLIIGLGITLVDGIILGQNLLVSNNIFHLLWQVPPLTWVSIVYYSESTATRNRRAGFLIWCLLMLTTFGLPFLIVPLFSLQ
jgi:uncharacterized membrane protein